MVYNIVITGKSLERAFDFLARGIQEDIQKIALIFRAKPKHIHQHIHQIISLLARLPASLNELQLNTTMTYVAVSDWIRMLAAIPPHIKTLDFTGVNFSGNMSVLGNSQNLEVLSASTTEVVNLDHALIIRNLPFSVNSLRFNGRGVDTYTAVLILMALPAQITHLDFQNSCIGDRGFSPCHLSDFFSSVPHQIVSLSLTNNPLGDEIRKSDLESLPKGTQVILGPQVRFCSRTNIELITPEGATEFDLKYMYLFCMSANKLGLALHRLPASIHTLDLSQNKLSRFSKQELGFILGCIPKTIKTLSLRVNFLGGRGSYDASLAAISRLHQSLNTLDLSHNFFGPFIRTFRELLCSDHLARLAKVLPRGLRRLNLSGTYLALITAKELTLFFQNLPPHLEYLDLSHTHIEDALSRASFQMRATQALAQFDALTLLLSIGDCFDEEDDCHERLQMILNIFPGQYVISTRQGARYASIQVQIVSEKKSTASLWRFFNPRKGYERIEAQTNGLQEASGQREHSHTKI